MSTMGSLRLAALAAAPLLVAPPAPAQKLLDKDQPRTAAANDPYTRGGDPELLKAAGYVSLGGPFEFGPSGQTTESISEHLSYLDLRWVETAHFKLGIALPKIKVTGDERDKLRAELTRLGEALPGIDPRTRQVDPWLRLHLYAQRLEDLYAEIQGFLGVKDEDFAALNGTHPVGQTYMGIGPYLGQTQKYEVLLLPSEGSYTDFMRSKIGLTTKFTQQWNYMDRGALSVMTHTDQADLRRDEALHGHLVHSEVHCLLNGFKFYSYDIPVWVREGCAHWFERRLNPRYNSFTASEGATAVAYNKEDWTGPVKKWVQGGKMPSFATLLNRRAFAELTVEDHLMSWSIIEFLETQHPGFLRTYFNQLCALLNAEHVPDVSGFNDAQRDLFRDELKMTYGQFEAAWREWVLSGEDED